MQETRLWTPRAHEEEARSRFLRTHRHLHCGTKGVEKGSGRRLYSPRASPYKGLVQRTRSGRVRIGDCRIPARVCASHLQRNTDLPGTWFKPHCAGADWEHYCNSWSAGFLGERLHRLLPGSPSNRKIRCGPRSRFMSHRSMGHETRSRSRADPRWESMGVDGKTRHRRRSSDPH